jgi:hypothetical protein
MQGEVNGQQGLFPASYVVPHSDTKNEAVAQYNLGANEGKGSWHFQLLFWTAVLTAEMVHIQPLLLP